jgi:cytochrome c oxidase subunit IV
MSGAGRRLAVSAGLAALTAASIGVKYAHLPRPLAWALLGALAVANAGLVVGATMHLAAAPRALKLAFLGALAYPVLFAVAVVLDAAIGSRGP